MLYILRLVPALEWLFLGLARPNALSRNFFRAFIVREPDAGSASDMVEPPSQTIAPFCPSLKSLYLLYKRWLRSPDQKALIVAFGDIVASRNSKMHHSLNLVLSIGEVRDSLGSGFQELLNGCWSIDTSGRKSPHTGNPEHILGISTRHGIIPISTAFFFFFFFCQQGPRLYYQSRLTQSRCLSLSREPRASLDALPKGRSEEIHLWTTTACWKHKADSPNGVHTVDSVRLDKRL